MARAGAAGGRERALRPAHALDRARPRAPDERRHRGACPRGRPVDGGGRARACVLLRRRLVHGRRGRGRVRRARIRRLHAARHAPAVPRRTVRRGRPWPLRRRWTCRRGGSCAAIPTTHSLGDLARALLRRDLPDLVHVYFHDTDLLSRRRSALAHDAPPLLARRATVSDLERIADGMDDAAPRVAWDDVARN